jgi:FkbM family methyltransferase
VGERKTAALGRLFEAMAASLAPEYLLRPSQAALRASRLLRSPPTAEQVRLPWGALLFVDPHEHIGGQTWRRGVYDLAACEALMRLADPGELALDVGANIGLMTSVLAFAVRGHGRVVSFEPHPLLVPLLDRNVGLWNGLGYGSVTVIPVALSDRSGVATLRMPPDFEFNRGRASLEYDYTGGHVNVETTTLDDLLVDQPRIGVMKIDVEGHEPRVFAGAKRLLASGRIRDIVFEDYDPRPSDSSSLLESLGFELFGLQKGMFAPRLRPLGPPGPDWDPPNCLATLDPERARRRLAARGWCALRPATNKVVPRVRNRGGGDRRRRE